MEIAIRIHYKGEKARDMAKQMHRSGDSRVRPYFVADDLCHLGIPLPDSTEQVCKSGIVLCFWKTQKDSPEHVSIRRGYHSAVAANKELLEARSIAHLTLDEAGRVRSTILGTNQPILQPKCKRNEQPPSSNIGKAPRLPSSISSARSSYTPLARTDSLRSVAKHASSSTSEKRIRQSPVSSPATTGLPPTGPFDVRVANHTTGSLQATERAFIKQELLDAEDEAFPTGIDKRPTDAISSANIADQHSAATIPLKQDLPSMQITEDVFREEQASFADNPHEWKLRYLQLEKALEDERRQRQVADVLLQMERIRSQQAEIALANERRQCEQLKAALEDERIRCAQAQGVAADIRRECRSPFIVPALVDVVSALARMTGEALKDVDKSTREVG